MAAVISISEDSGFRTKHISDLDLECYHLGMVTDEAELSALEVHLIACEDCVARAEQTAEYVDQIRRVLSADEIAASEPALTLRAGM